MKNAMQLKAKIKELAKKNQVPAQAILQNYMLERLLERISLSSYQDKFILKGGMLVAAIVGLDSRTTMDMDATLKGYPLSPESVRKALDEICSVALDDEVTFSLLAIEPIREDDDYGGFRASLEATYDTIKTPLKVDITTGDAITPREVLYTFKTIFDDRAIQIWAYNIETVLAEKYETILRRGILNTWPRDYYDIYMLVKTQKDNIDPATLKKAILATTEKRQSVEVLQNKDTILASIRADAVMRRRWTQYCREYPYAAGIDFDDVIAVINEIES